MVKKLLVFGLLPSVLLPFFTTQLVKTQEAPVLPIPTKWSKLSFPVESFQAYTSGFGWRWNHTDFHPGLDIAAPYGSYIHNWLAGRAISVAQDRRCGLHIIIQSGRWQAIYCHMDGQITSSPQGNTLMLRQCGIQISEGQIISTGAIIGRVGMTGRTTGPHLHFQLEHDTELINPALVLKAMYLAERKQVIAAKVSGVSKGQPLTVPLSPS